MQKKKDHDYLQEEEKQIQFVCVCFKKIGGAMDDVVGGADETKKPQYSIQQLYDPYSRLFESRIQKFPGALPATLTREQLPLLHYGYVVATKADGVRVFVIINKNQILLHRRDNCVSRYFLPGQNYDSYLFDAEYIQDQNLLLLFDTLIFKNVSAIMLSIEQRVELVNLFLTKIVPSEEQHFFANSYLQSKNVAPLPSQYKWGITWYPFKTIKLQAKPIYHLKHAPALFEHRDRLPYMSDGLIFTRILCAYFPFTQDKDAVLKWKQYTTIDFRLRKMTHTYEVENETLGLMEDHGFRHKEREFEFFLNPKNQRHANYKLLSIDKDSPVIVSCCVMTEEKDEDTLTDKIGEFSWNRKQCIWELLKIRADKETPNAFYTVLRSFNSILDDIQIHEIVN